MNKNSVYYELQQFIRKKETDEPSSKGTEVASTSAPSGSNQPTQTEVPESSQASQNVEWKSNIQASSAKSSSHATNSQASTSGRVPDSSYTRNKSSSHHPQKKERRKSFSSETPKMTKPEKVMATCKHHSFLSEVPDVRHMEQALLQLLEDFHSGNLRAFGKDCSMEQMTKIREQQEKLARLHFEMGQNQDGSEPSASGFRQSSANMQNLLQRLEQLSLCIEKLHSK